MNAAATWFCWTVWLGILVNLSFAIPAIFAPDIIFSLFQLKPADQLIWIHDAGLLLLILSLFYIPAANNPYRYQINSWLLVIARFVFAVFWLLSTIFSDQSAHYLSFGIADLGIGLLQGVLLWRVFSNSTSAASKALAESREFINPNN